MKKQVIYRVDVDYNHKSGRHHRKPIDYYIQDVLGILIRFLCYIYCIRNYFLIKIIDPTTGLSVYWLIHSKLMKVIISLEKDSACR